MSVAFLYFCKSCIITLHVPTFSFTSHPIRPQSDQTRAPAPPSPIHSPFRHSSLLFAYAHPPALPRAYSPVSDPIPSLITSVLQRSTHSTTLFITSFPFAFLSSSVRRSLLHLLYDGMSFHPSPIRSIPSPPLTTHNTHDARTDPWTHMLIYVRC